MAFRKHRDKVFGFAFYLLRNQEDAEDVTQEVFVNLWKHWKGINRQKQEAWIMKTTRNKCIDVIRKRQSSLSRVQGIEWESLAFSVDETESPHAQLELTETQDSVLRVLYTLPEKIQSVLLLYYFQDMKINTIGDVLDVNLNTVKVTLHRGRKMLKEALKNQCPDVVEGL
ncbi:RNA polymerase sigma factor [bacterium]|nr:RNA polymerase sigma factor [bacterium]